MAGQTLHDVRADAFNYVWDNSIAPAVEVESGETSSCTCAMRATSRSRRSRAPTRSRALDFSHVNPVTGPVFVKGARPGDMLAVEILELRPRDWGWTAIIPGFGLLADEFPDPWLRISKVERGRPPGRASPTASRCRSSRSRARSGSRCPSRASTRSSRRRLWGGNMDIKHLRVGHDAVPARRRRGRALLGRRHPRRDGRRRGVRHGRRGGDGHRRAAERAPRHDDRRRRSTTSRRATSPAPRPARYHVTTGVGPDLMEATREATRAMIGHLGRAAGSTGRRPTRSARWPATCASTRSSTRPTGWWACSCPRHLREGDS